MKTLFLSRMATNFNISTYLPATITTRKAIEIIESNLSVPHDMNIVFDFEGIDFISRAFADELVHLIERKKINSFFVNTTSAINSILNAVQKNRQKRDNTFHDIAITHYKDSKQLNQLLALI